MGIIVLFFYLTIYFFNDVIKNQEELTDKQF